TRFDCDWSSDVCSSDLLFQFYSADIQRNWADRTSFPGQRSIPEMRFCRPNYAGYLQSKIETAFSQGNNPPSPYPSSCSSPPGNKIVRASCRDRVSFSVS